MTALDMYKSLGRTYEMPSNLLIDVTPSDANELQYITRGIYIGSIGDLAVEDEAGNQVIFYSLVPGIILPIRVKKILATGTSVTGIIALV